MEQKNEKIRKTLTRKKIFAASQFPFVFTIRIRIFLTLFCSFCGYFDVIVGKINSRFFNNRVVFLIILWVKGTILLLLLYNSMVPFTHKIISISGRIFSLKQNLTCADYGVDVATCKLCSEQYVGQTANKFSKRWTTHRSQRKANTQQKNDNAALRLHSPNFHQGQINPQLSECNEITRYLNPMTLVI